MNFLRKVIFNTIKIAIAVAVLYFLVHSAQIKPALFWDLLQYPILFLSAAGLLLAMIIVSAWRWWVLNTTQGIHLRFSSTAVATYLGVAFNNLLPGSVGGDVVRSFYLFRRVPTMKNRALLTILIDRVLGFVGVLVLLCGATVTHLHLLTEQPTTFYLLLTCTLLCLSALLLFALCMWLPRRIALGSWLEKRFSHKRLGRGMVSFLAAVSGFRLSWLAFFNCLAISVLIQLVTVVIITIIAKMMGVHSIAFSDYVIAMCVTQIVNLIPLTPGGIGIGEMAFANVLLLLNPGVAVAYATIYLAFRFIGVTVYLPGVIFGTLGHRLILRRSLENAAIIKEQA